MTTRASLLAIPLLIWAAVAGADGAPGVDWFPVSPLDSHESEWQASLAYNSVRQQYLAVWEQATPGGEILIWGQLLGRDGTQVGGRFQVPSPSGQSTAPDVAYSPVRDEYLVVYTSVSTANSVSGHRLSALGTPLGSQLTFASSTEHTYGHAAVVSVPGGDQYLLAWQKCSGTAFAGIEARSVGAGGTTMGPILEVTGLLANVAPAMPDVAYTQPLDRALVVWEKWSDSTQVDRDVWGQWVDMAGGAHLTGVPFTLFASTDDEALPAVGGVATVFGIGELLVACQRTYGSAPYVDGLLITDTGALVASLPISLQTGIMPAVADNADTRELLVAWVSGLEVQAREVSPAGVMSMWGAVEAVLAPAVPDVAGGPAGDFLVTTQFPTSPGDHYDVFGFLWQPALFGDGFETGGTGAWASVVP